MLSEVKQVPFTAIKAVLAAVIFSIAMYIGIQIGPWIEARVNPVVTDFRIMQIEALDESRTNVWVQFEKLRGRECEYLGIGWYSGDGVNALNRVELNLNKRPEDASSSTRPTGLQRAGPWTVNLPIDQVLSHSTVVTWYRCNPVWITQANLYP